VKHKCSLKGCGSSTGGLQVTIYSGSVTAMSENSASLNNLSTMYTLHSVAGKDEESLQRPRTMLYCSPKTKQEKGYSGAPVGCTSLLDRSHLITPKTPGCSFSTSLPKAIRNRKPVTRNPQNLSPTLSLFKVNVNTFNPRVKCNNRIFWKTGERLNPD
jgi:hypothetical protein